MKPILFTFGFAATLAAQNFIQMPDAQFGMFTKDASFEHETVNFEFAIATANRLKPAFVVTTGDLISKGGDAAQAAEFQRISAKLDPKIRLFSIPGNHDVGNEPTAESLALYRERLGLNGCRNRRPEVIVGPTQLP
jgi:predicted MPP superfamily phosphohydrolase